MRRFLFFLGRRHGFIGQNLPSLNFELTSRPVGIIRTAKPQKFHAAHQPDEAAEEHNVLELFPSCDYEQALQDLEGFSRVWLVWWFHRNESWKPQVIPPRGPKKKRGVFATRSPHRPNPIGITPVKLLGVKGRKVILGPCDLVDGTPVLDIKPYIPAYDSFPDERAGWIDELDAELASAPKFTVLFAPLAQAQGDWLASHHGIDFRPRVAELLARDPSPHRGRRIRERGDGLSEIGCGAWRAYFEIEGDRVTVLALDAAYPADVFLDPEKTRIPDREAQIAFTLKWPRRPRA